ncbi:YjzC family protein [Fictibacillus sp. WQ 8-8]|uniref:YjzC family protein n=1 Tax=Fictibacillus sp. WQ 8-8 TaxID=2938788 RepID=UPI0008E6B0B4|nr:YjzC family protein [Fictibacillus sp. WQ 8-8]MCQ6265546.1 YjzC family protein [Fictibacillus sp. WQ 8-8]SFE07666.1 YjzC-like protein [Bacillus sp. OV194]
MFKSGETVNVNGTYAEAGHGGGKVKRGQRVELQEGSTFPELKPYTIEISHGGETKTRNRQHQWKLVK